MNSGVYPLTLSPEASLRSNSQNLTSLSALPLINAWPSDRTCKDHTVAVCAFTVSIRDEDAMSNIRISPVLVPTAIYGGEISTRE